MKIKLCAALLLASTFIACEKADKDVLWGISKLYMPQAVIQSGGTDINYTVSVDKAAAGDVSVVVGLYRSGLEELKSVSVDLEVYPDTLDRAIEIAGGVNPPAAYNIYKTARLLPAAYYDVPGRISLNDGERESSVKLLVKKELLATDPFFVEGNRYILPLRITNLTRYELNSALSLTMFIFEPK